MMKPVSTTKLLDIGIALSKEKDPEKLLETILVAAMEMMNCDGGTLYIKERDCLKFKLMITKSLDIFKGGHSEIDLPPVKLTRKNVCAFSAIEGRLVNIEDVYESEKFDFSGPRNYDKLTGYRTTSMLVVPMENDYGEIIGVMQFLNALTDEGEITSFDEGYEPVVMSLASQAAISLTNVNYSNEITDILNSFVQVMSTAIDERSPYNANHTKNMERYAQRFMDWLNENTDWKFSELHRHQLLMSIWLHDVGKLVIPLEVMDKTSRLGLRLHEIERRFEYIALSNEISFLKNEMSKEEYEARCKSFKDAWELINSVNHVGFLTDEMLTKVQDCAKLTYVDSDGKVQPLLNDEELTCLSVRKGTLTEAERKEMERHVSATKKMLDKMHFSRNYHMVPKWAASHHEFLNGTGYPEGLSGDAIPLEVRLITILDIYDALTAVDRPYKRGMPAEKALSILGEMAEKEGKLDKGILEMFKESGAWEMEDESGRPH